MDAEYIILFLRSLLILAIAINVLHFIYVCYRSWKRNNAPVETSRAVAYYKDPDMKASLHGRNHTYVFHIIFHTESGEILNLYMGRDQYYRIPEGATGALTWQEKKFWSFKMEDGTEVN